VTVETAALMEDGVGGMALPLHATKLRALAHPTAAVSGDLDLDQVSEGERESCKLGTVKIREIERGWIAKLQAWTSAQIWKHLNGRSDSGTYRRR